MGLFSNKRDEGHLARTRKEQFGFTIRNNVSMLFVANVLTFLFLVPLIVVTIFSLITYRKYLSMEDVDALTLFSIFAYSGLGVFISIIIYGLGLSGINEMIKELILLSTTHVRAFFVGIRNNFKEYFFIHLTLGLVGGIFVINLGFYLYIPFDGVFKLVALIINILLLLTLLIAKSYVNFEASIYKNSFPLIMRNGIYLFYKGMPYSLISIATIIVPSLLICFLPVEVIFIPIGLLATCYISLRSLANYLISISVYEKIVPPENIKEIYHVGLEDINL